MLWVQEVLDAGCSGWCGHEQQRFLPWLLDKRWFYLCFQGKPASGFDLSCFPSEFVECEKNITTTNPKASFLYKDVYLPGLLRVWWGGSFQVEWGIQQKTKGQKSMLSRDHKPMLLHVVRTFFLSEQCRWLHWLSMSFSPGFYDSTLTGIIKISILFGVRLHWPSNYVWVKPGTYSWVIFGSHQTPA